MSKEEPKKVKKIKSSVIEDEEPKPSPSNKPYDNLPKQEVDSSSKVRLLMNKIISKKDNVIVEKGSIGTILSFLNGFYFVEFVATNNKKHIAYLRKDEFEKIE